ncbi:hypothetical protein KKH35_00655 [Patescibacteria group bacterium]|nr:hypothetical protein [Patescibacteria group bacterium]
MAKKFKKRHSNRTFRFFDERKLLNSATLKSLIILNIDTGAKCQLPSCYEIIKDSNKASRHHWTYQGRAEDPLFFPKAIHIFCGNSCHDRVHKIAAVIIFYLEIFICINTEALIKKVARALKETYENVAFVLTKELKPASLVQVKKEKCQLIVARNDRRIRNIKIYIKINDRELDFKMKNLYPLIES